MLSTNFLFSPTGVDTAARAVFTLAALQAHGLLAEEGLPRGQASAVVRLHNAANAGSSDALYALADRFMHGHGVPKNETIALKYAHLAADRLAVEVELVRSCRVTYFIF